MCASGLLVGTKSVFYPSQNAPIADWTRQFNVGTRESRIFCAETKTADVYFNFNVNTNPEERLKCADAISLPMLPMVSVKENIERLATYRWCICPEGNGVDTHRLWECLYLGCVPIVKRTPFIDVLVHHMEIPLIILDEWNQFCVPDNYREPAINRQLTLQYYIDEITKT